MSNGLGAGFAALTLLAALGGLAIVSLLATVAAAVLVRRTGRLPGPLRYVFAALGVAVLGVTGFGVLALYDEAPAAAGLFLLLGLLPPPCVGLYLHGRLAVSALDLVATTVMAWAAPFLVGVAVAFGSMSALSTLFDVPPGGASGTSVPWIASALGGVVVALGAGVLGPRLVDVARSSTVLRDR